MIQLPFGTTRNYDGPKVAMSGDRLVMQPESHADSAARPLSNLPGSIRKASQQTLRWIVNMRIDCRFGVQAHNLVVVGSNPTSHPDETW